jgi:hypothetical protein
MATNPTLLTQPIAANGAKNVIPNTTSTVGAMSQDQGFPAETALPLGAGGVAPTREDFNGAFNLLSGIAFMAQKGWVFLFDENQDYFAGCTVRDPLDGKIYEAINDVSASSTHPSVDSVNWKQSVDMSAYTTTVNSPMFNKHDVITTSGTYTAPVTGWYKITVKGGGGGGSGSANTGNGNGGGAGGGEGGTTIAYERMNVGDTATVVIGAGGTGGDASGTGGTDGGDSSVTIGGNTYTAGGGKKSNRRTKAGNGGAGTIRGFGGSVGGTIGTESYGTGGTGGGAGGGVALLDAVGVDGINGGGGAGGTGYQSTNHIGGNGGNGYAWFEYFDSTLNP